MMNTMEIEGYRAVIRYDPEIEMFRGEFLGLNGGADFYACDIEGLRKEGSLSLKVFLEMCGKKESNPRKRTPGSSTCGFLRGCTQQSPVLPLLKAKV